jgi:uncharacterized RDD family membrane protein YckC
MLKEAGCFCIILSDNVQAGFLAVHMLCRHLRKSNYMAIFWIPKTSTMEDSYQTQVHSENVLDGLDISLVQAGSGKRLANFLIDRLFFYFLWKFLLVKFTVTVISLFGIDIEDRTMFVIGIWLFVIVFDVSCLAAIESITGGKTIGKYITGTRAVNEDGTRISPKTALFRSLSRIVPFEAFSALGSPCHPWHDRWTNTFVVDERLSQIPV